MNKMYMIRGLNSLYFVWTALPLKAVNLYIRAGESAEECDPSAAYSIRYGGQPIYEIREAIDRRNGLPYIAESVVDKRQLLPELNIVPERRFF